MDLYWDVDGTLLDHNDVIRPFVDDCFIYLSMRGFNIYVWSGGGTDYAKRQVERIMLYINHIHGKLHKINPVILPKDYSYIRHKDARSFVIDDIEFPTAIFKEFGGAGYHIPFYDSNLMSSDNEISKVYHAIIDRFRKINE